MIKPIVIEKEILEKVAFTSPIDVHSLCIAKDLVDTMHFQWSQGRICQSISANQIGENERIIAIATGLGGKIQTFFNPEILFAREEMISWEDNFSRPGLMFKTQRAYMVVVRFSTETGMERVVHAEGQKAALFQQEIDNLNGILPEDRAEMVAEVGCKEPNPKYLKDINL